MHEAGLILVLEGTESKNCVFFIFNIHFFLYETKPETDKHCFQCCDFKKSA